MPLDLDHRTEDGVDIVTVSGDLDVYTASRLREMVTDLDQRCQRRWLVLDLAGCGFLDNTGLGVIVGALKRAREAGGSVAVAGARESVSRVFAVTGLAKFFPMHWSAEDAVKALRAEQERADA